MAGLHLYVEWDLQDTLSGEVPWENYMRSRLISDKELSYIRRYDKRSEDLRAGMLEENGCQYVESFLTVLKSVTEPASLQYTLAILLDMLQGNPWRGRLFHSIGKKDDSHPDPYTPLLKLLQHPVWRVQEMAARVLAAVIICRPRKSNAFLNGYLSSDQSPSAPWAAQGPPDAAEEHIAAFIDWLSTQLQRPSATSSTTTSTNNNASTAMAASVLAVLLSERGCRSLLMRTQALRLLPSLLKAYNCHTNSQLLYDLGMCVWQMSFSKEAAKAMAGAGVVKMLVEVAKLSEKEKVLRVSLSALNNLLSYEDLGLAGDMVEVGLHKIVENRRLQQWADEDVGALLELIDDQLRSRIKLLSTFDKYVKEVMGGQMDWSPMHSSDVFWQENMQRFEEKNFQVLRVLLKLIEGSREVKTLAVGCHDIGMFISHHPQGKFIIRDLRGKELVMRLMAHPDAEVQKQALRCIQKLMLSKDKQEFLLG